MKSERTKYTEIPFEVKYEVFIRDGRRCIFCKDINAQPEAHIISRAAGGAGVAKNIITVCRPCHQLMDQNVNREEMVKKAKEYVRFKHGDFDDSEVIYDRRRDSK